ncbi:M48 family metallopeptidase [Aureisphaera galaxeae]|uniref:M48 family metallopeptidase n=1 Tax=Aureisphaera galaxeae TaxID=1538023 RepID=UPI0023502EEC|nr:M48 family metallopeptidase [Aureisphaera galaxeae]MDC8004119.1 M48 family metallopeptidase [Aureisphaera galaxeae]
MQSLYSSGPTNVPPQLTKPTASFTKHVWLSVTGLLLFAVLYIVLMVWFGRLAYYTWMSGGSLWNYILAGGYSFLCLFMLKSLFFLSKREENPMRHYVTQKEEPVLFDFLYKLADEAGAPRPHKVFLTDRVNASVSYDLSLLNLIFPSKKNLEIGLGLVNVLSLGEFKAVLAHEFGHFAQRSMLLGRYVYVAQQIAARIIGKRDIFDSFLNLISSIDIRISWIGWILSILVWAVRALIETCFSVVRVAERALSREMEFQADLVAVSLTGSDALIHALHRLQVADEAYANAVDVVNMKLGDKKAVKNLYKLQSNYIEKMAWVLNQPDFGQSPKIHEENPESHRIFSSRAYNPPQMWATHPADKDREENAKRQYIAAEIDERPADSLLSDPEAFEESMTAALIKTAKVETEIMPTEEAITYQNKEYFNWSFLDPKYNSAFLNRFAYTNFDTVEEVLNHEIANTSDFAPEFDRLYGELMAQKLEEMKEIKEEIEALEVARNEVVTMEKRTIWHRGDRIKRKDIPELVKGLQIEEKEIRDRLKNHDSRARTLHWKAASIMNPGWGNYLKSLNHLIHYAEHAIADIADCGRKFHNVLAVALADGNVSSSEMNEILMVSNDYYKTVKAPYVQSKKIHLDAELLKKLGKPTYADTFEEFTLGWPEKDNIDRWVNVIDGWAGVARSSLMAVRNIALEKLLEIEAQVKESYLTNKSMATSAPGSISIVPEYNLRTPGTERKIQRKLKLWDRFIIGEGLFGSAAKFGVSALLVFGALGLGSFTTGTEMYLYNGLSIPVIVTIDGDKELELPPNDHTKIAVDNGETYRFVATTEDGTVIEEFEGDVSNPKYKYIYNVAQAGAFLEYKVFYGYDGTSNDRKLGTKSWLEVKADYILEEPPTTIRLSSSSSGTSKKVVAAYSGIDPYDLVTILDDDGDISNIIKTHVEWDDPSSENIMNWLNIVSRSEAPLESLSKRLEHYDQDVATLRAIMNESDSIQRIDFCKDMKQKSEAAPNNPNYYYLSARCLESDPEKNTLFVSGYEKWEDHPWLAYASGYIYAQDEEWEKSYDAFTNAANGNEGLMEVFAVDAERVRRMLEKTTDDAEKATFRNIVSDDLQYKLSIDRGNIDSPSYNPDNTYILLKQGKLEEAYSFVEQYENYKPYIYRVLAVSDGATNEMREAALALDPMAGIDTATIWYTLALNIQENRTNEDLLTTFGLMGLEEDAISAFERVLKEKNVVGIENLIRAQEIYFKGYMYAAACIVLKDKAPGSWRTMANTMLLGGESPYFAE